MHAATQEAANTLQKAPINPEKAEPGWPPVVVAGAYHTGVVLMRNLLRRGLRVWCFDASASQPAFKSVYGKTLLCPNPDVDPKAWLSFMLGLADNIGQKPVLIASADQFVSAIAEHADDLQERFIFNAAATRIQGVLATKRRQYELASQHGLTIPRSQLITSSRDLDEFSNTVNYPCIMKPLHCREWEKLPHGHPLLNKKLATALSREELRHSYESVQSVTSELVVQEIIEGPDTAKFVYLSCYARSGKRLGNCIVREVRTDPIYFGSASVVEPTTEVETDSACDHFLQSVGYSGICEIEVKRDSRDGRIKLIEVNPRYSVTADAAPYAGVDIGWLHYLDLIGMEVIPVGPSQKNFRHICLQRDFAAFRGYQKAGLLPLRELLRSYRPPLHFYDLDLRDWRVALGTLIQVFKTAFGPYIRRVIPKRRRVT